jgi:hypothetical protein
MKSVNCKYSIGDEVFVIKHNSYVVGEDCKYCKGKGTIKIRSKEFICPSACSSGKVFGITNYKWEVCKIPCYIKLINIFITSKDIERSYRIYPGPTGSICEQNLFPSLKKAISECNKRNKI